MKTTLGNVSAMLFDCEYCDRDMLADSEKGVPAQFFEKEIVEETCDARASLRFVAA